MRKSLKRDRIVETALRLFYRNGFHATGIDRIIAEAGVARMTLYKHFKSKDDLILAVLRLRDEEFRDWFKESVEARTQDPRERLLAIFDALNDWFNGKAFPSKGFSGCAFINACAEFSDPDNPAHRAAADHKMVLLDYVTSLAVTAGAREPEKLARELMLLKEGATVTTQVSGDPYAARRAKRIASLLIEAQCAPRPARERRDDAAQPQLA